MPAAPEKTDLVASQKVPHYVRKKKSTFTRSVLCSVLACDIV